MDYTPPHPDLKQVLEAILFLERENAKLADEYARIRKINEERITVMRSRLYQLQQPNFYVPCAPTISANVIHLHQPFIRKKHLTLVHSRKDSK